jgi:hypothetical protein
MEKKVYILAHIFRKNIQIAKFLTWGLGKGLTSPHCKSPPCYKIT